MHYLPEVVFRLEKDILRVLKATVRGNEQFKLREEHHKGIISGYPKLMVTLSTAPPPKLFEPHGSHRVGFTPKQNLSASCRLANLAPSLTKEEKYRE